MARCYEIKGNRLIFLDNGKKYIDDDDKKHITGSFTEIEFPSCYTMLCDDDFDYCKDQLAKVTKIDFTKAIKIEDIDDDTFTGAKSLKVVVLPKNIKSINEFKECPNLKEIHIYKLEDLYSITKDEDKRLTVYASQVSSDIDSFDEGFLSDVGILYVPANKVRQMEKARDDYDDELDIRPLPDGYSFPTEALSEPWQPSSTSGSGRRVNSVASNSNIDTIKTSQFTYKDGVLTINEGSKGWYDFRESVFDIRDSDDDAFEKLTKKTRKVIIPSTWGDIGEETFDEFEDSQITCLDMMKATGLDEICVSWFPELKVAVIPKQICGLSKIDFNDCPKLQEIHIYNLDEDIAAITHDEDKRLTVYASKISDEIEYLSDDFVDDVGILYAPAKDIKILKEALWNYENKDAALDIRPLPDGYSFPTEALSEPWQEVENNHNSASISGFNPFNKGEEKYKYIVRVNEAGDDKDAVAKAVMEICKCTKQKAKEFVDELDDLLHDDEICSVESEATAKSIKQKLMNAGAGVSIHKCEYKIRIDKVTQKLQTIKEVMEIQKCGLKEAKDLVDSVDEDALFGTEIKMVETLEEARSIKAKLEAVGAKVSISTSSNVIDEDDEDDLVQKISKEAGIDNLSEKEIDELFQSDDEDEETPSFDLDQVYGGPQYHCVLEGKSFGPVTIRQFANMVRFGIVDKNTMVWKEGMVNWALAQSVAELQAVL